MLRELFSKLSTPNPIRPSDPTAEKLRTLLPVCPICDKELKDHRYVQLATAYVEATVAEVFNLIRSHRWTELITVNEWNPQANAIVVYAIAGPHPGGTVIAVKSARELFEPDDVYLKEILSSDEMSSLVAALGETPWEHF